MAEGGKGLVASEQSIQVHLYACVHLCIHNHRVNICRICLLCVNYNRLVGIMYTPKMICY